MASKIIGRRKCPWCAFEGAHVKESEKCLYMYCPSCGTNGPHARTEQQRQNMLKGARLVEEPAPSPTPTPTVRSEKAPAEPATEPAAVPTPTPTPTHTPAEPKRRGLFF